MKIKSDETIEPKWFKYPDDEDEYLIKYSPSLRPMTDFESFKAIVKDWRNVEFENGSNKMTDANIEKWLNWEGSLPRYAWIVAKALSQSNFWELEKMQKNLSGS